MNRGKPGAFAEDVVRVEDEPIPVNYHREDRYKAQCPECGDWYRAHRKEDAKTDARRCCGTEITEAENHG